MFYGAGYSSAMRSYQGKPVSNRTAASSSGSIGEVDLHISGHGEFLMVGHFMATIPGQRAAQCARQFEHLFDERRYYTRAVLAGHLDQYYIPRMALDQGSDVRVPAPTQQIAFPMPWYGAILRLGGALTNRDRVHDLPAPPTRVGHAIRTAQPFCRTQMRDQLLLQRTACLHEQRSIYGLVRNVHAGVHWKLLFKPAPNLLGRPLRPKFTRHRIP